MVYAGVGPGLTKLPYLLPAAYDVLAERRRQIEDEGWSPSDDDRRTDYSMAKVAAAYAIAATLEPETRKMVDAHGKLCTPWWIVRMWPESWSLSWLKPTSRRRDLVKAGALIIAEIERLDRADAAAPQGDDA